MRELYKENIRNILYNNSKSEFGCGCNCNTNCTSGCVPGKQMNHYYDVTAPKVKELYNRKEAKISQ